MEHCKHFVVRKKRFCKMTVKAGEEYCGEHQKTVDKDTPLGKDSDKKLRIVCPLDRKHTCYAHNLKKHLKICNASRVTNEPYISKGINYCSSNVDDNSMKPLSNFNSARIKLTIEKLIKFHDVIGENITVKILTHQLIENEISNPEDGHEYGPKTMKHLKQVSSILGLLTEYKLFNPNTCYIEFGAGRGQLSYWICKATEGDEKSKILLIERASPKHKKDNKLSKSSDRTTRIRADISDLVLDKVDTISHVNHIVGLAKHLCGEATDLALHCLKNTANSRQKIKGGVFTFCCHHRCRWVPYAGKEYFQENGFDNEDFNIMCGMASWATCGTGFSREKNKNLTNFETAPPDDRGSELGFTRAEKEEIGKKSKNLINLGRLEYLKKLGFNCKLHYYVNKDVTLENVCIVIYT